jgi:hypothetical protein
MTEPRNTMTDEERDQRDLERDQRAKSRGIIDIFIEDFEDPRLESYDDRAELQVFIKGLMKDTRADGWYIHIFNAGYTEPWFPGYLRLCLYKNQKRSVKSLLQFETDDENWSLSNFSKADSETLRTQFRKTCILEDFYHDKAMEHLYGERANE